MIAKAAVELDLGDRTDADAHTERTEAPQVAAQTRHRKNCVVSEVQTALEQEIAWRNGFGVLRDQRTGLRQGSRREQQEDSGANEATSHGHSLRGSEKP